MATKLLEMPKPEEILPDREEPITVSTKHAVNGNPTVPPFLEQMQMAMFGMGCFWGVEKRFWGEHGVHSTQVGYSNGYTKNPTYEDVCTGRTGHAEVVRIIFDPKDISYTDLLQIFWENHDPTQVNRQGRDEGTQYRSGIYYYSDDQKAEAESTREKYDRTLQDREEPITVASKHTVNGNPTLPPFPEQMQMAMFGMGCFWGVEKRFWGELGVYSTQVGYSNGYTRNPTYEDVCTGRTGHAEVVRIIFDPKNISYTDLLKIFWENHDPTQVNRQGRSQGTQYRSCIYYYNDDQKAEAESTKEKYDRTLQGEGHNKVVTEIKPVAEFFYYAEDYHQQYLHKNPEGYCGLKGTGVRCILK